MGLLDISIKSYQQDEGFSFHVQQQKFGIRCSCGRFRTFFIDQLDYPDSHLAETLPEDLSSIPTLKFPTGNVLAFSCGLPMSLFRPVKFSLGHWEW